MYFESFISITANLSLISGIFVVIVGLFVYLKNKHSKVNQLFSLFTLAMSVWLFSSYMMFICGTDEGAIFWDRMVYVGVVFIPYLSLNFSLAFTKSEKQKKIVLLGFILSTFFLIISRTDYFVANELFKHPWGVHTKARFFHHVFMLYFASYILLTYYNLYKCYKYTKSPLIKQQAKYIFLAFLIFIGVGSIAYLPAYGIGVPPFGYAAGVVFTILVAYSIIRYRLMDIKLVITRSFIFFFLTLAVTATFVLASTFSAYLYAGAAGRAQYVIWAVAALVVVLTLDPLKRGLAQWTDSIFFKGRIDYDAILKRLTKILSEEVDARNIIIKTQSRLSEDLKINDATLLISFGDNYFLQPEEINNVPTSSSEQRKRHFYPSLVEYLTQDRGILIMDELERKISDTVDEKELLRLESVFKDARNIEAALIAPVFRENEITALLLLGHKTSGDVFNNEDINMLEVLSPQLSAALFKANLFQEAKLFNIKLKQEVEKATCQLKEANAHLQELDKAKSEFMSIASHQLRTPLSGIMGYLSMVLDGDYGKLSKEQAPIMKEVFGASQRLIRMVNLFLNVTRIEAGKLKFNFTKIEIKKTIKDLTHELKPAADKKKIKLIYKRTSEKIPEIQADADKIQDIILNLIDNAIKYTDGGRIEVSVAKQGESHIQIKVVDTGMGIDPLEAGKLFNKFVRGDGMLRINPDGAGLGLFIAKKIVEGHKGKIWAESEGLEKGSVFNVILPIKQN